MAWMLPAAIIGSALINRSSGKSSSGSSGPVFKPPMMSESQIGQTIGDIRNYTSNPFNLSPASSVYRKPLETAIMNPYQPTSSENQLLENIMGQTSSQFARRGLGGSPIAASSVAASIAPSMVQMRQNQIEAIRQALQGDVAEQGSLSQLNLQSWLAKIQSLLSLLETAGKYQPLGQTSTQTGGKPGLFEGLPISFSYSNVGMKTPGKGVTD